MSFIVTPVPVIKRRAPSAVHHHISLQAQYTITLVTITIVSKHRTPSH